MSYKPKVLATTEGGTNVAAAGTSGNVLTSDGANWTSAAASGGLSSLLNTPEWFDDFQCGSTETGEIGELGWLTQVNGGTFSLPTGLNKPGVAQLSVTTTGTTIGIITQSVSSVQTGLGILTYKTSVNLPILSAADEIIKVWIGLFDNASFNDSGEGIYFTYSHSLNSGNWTLNTSDSPGSTTATSSGIAATTGWVQLGFVCNAAATSVEFFIAGVSVGTITTTIPQSTDLSTWFYGLSKTGGTTGTAARVLNIDAFYAKYALTTTRFV